MRCVLALSCLLALIAPWLANASPADPFLWLEDKDGARAMAWVRAQNAKTLAVLKADPHYKTFYSEALEILQSKDRIPTPTFVGREVYNFWQDGVHVRGIWRRTTLRSYESAKPHWTTVLDLDAVAKANNANWVWKGADCEPWTLRRCLVQLSDGGEDAVTIREFDLRTRRFVPGGFLLPRAKQSAIWLDRDTILIARAQRPSELTKAGYPYVVRILKRGQAPADAREIFRGAPSDDGIDLAHLHDGAGHDAAVILHEPSFFSTGFYLVNAGRAIRLGVPRKCELTDMVGGRLLFTLKQDWRVAGTSFPQGALVSIDFASAIAHPAHLRPQLVYDPGTRAFLEGATATKDALLVVAYENVRARAYVYRPLPSGWQRVRLNLPELVSIDIAAAGPGSDDFFVDVSGFLTPTTLYAGNTRSHALTRTKALPPQFDASNDVVEQYWATSKDGTKIPYFIVHPTNMQLDGSNPTELNAYGGFDIPSLPFYSGPVGKTWLEHGGVFVVANIRGGGEFGPAWHDAGLKTHRQRIYDDFYAVAKDLVRRKITSPRRLGIFGGSNGGLLMGVEFVQHPEMWNAVDIQVPLLDMLRYEKIQAGASWVAEYGSVSVPAERAFLEKISPYANLKKNVRYPEPLVWTTTKDDRVGPQHARKFAAKLEALGHPCLFFEVTEGGHASGANLREEAQTSALQTTYFAMKLLEK